MQRNSAVNLGVWLALVLCTALAMVAMNRSSLRGGLTMKTAEGVIVGYVPGPEQRCSYMYSVNGRPFQGLAMPAERRLEDLKLGGTVTVFYAEGDPGNSTLVAPRSAFAKTVGLTVAACAVVPVVLMCLLHAFGLLPPYSLFRWCREWRALRLFDRRLKAEV